MKSYGRLAYWQAKAELCRNLALEGKDKTANLMRMAYALEQARIIENAELTIFDSQEAE